MRTVILLPTYNERENLPALIEEIRATVDADLMVLDDESPDGTGHAADLLAKKDPKITVVHRSARAGMSKAYLDGFQRALAADYGQIFQMDADFSHQPRYLPKLLAALESADVAIGSRYVSGGRVEQWGLARRGVSRVANVYAGAILGMPYKDTTSGFVGWRRHALEAISPETITSEGHAFQVELKFRAHKRGLSLVEVPISFWDRVVGSSKLTQQNALESALDLARLRLQR
jgi:dolichol-phosphate mannosyltransferase